ncbi:MAG: T9SS type A sorting domain-containing protein [Saprospiraceae bacterium]|nr:T9SS type A sorting domain-containing protein [Saprospiraceae bacterium]
MSFDEEIDILNKYFDDSTSNVLTTDKISLGSKKVLDHYDIYLESEGITTTYITHVYNSEYEQFSHNPKTTVIWEDSIGYYDFQDSVISITSFIAFDSTFLSEPNLSLLQAFPFVNNDIIASFTSDGWEFKETSLNNYRFKKDSFVYIFNNDSVSYQVITRINNVNKRIESHSYTEIQPGEFYPFKEVSISNKIKVSGINYTTMEICKRSNFNFERTNNSSQLVKRNTYSNYIKYSMFENGILLFLPKDHSQNVEFQVYTLGGIQIYKTISNKSQVYINLANYACGFYILKIHGNFIDKSIKIVKQ